MIASAERPQFAVVDDDPSMTQWLSSLLTSREVESAVFVGGRKLLKSVNLPNFKAIILNLSLPDIDGFAVMDALAAGKTKTPILLMSRHDLSILRAATMYGTEIGLNVQGTLQKPFTQKDFFTAASLEAQPA